MILLASPGIAVAVLLIHVPEGGVLLEQSTCKEDTYTIMYTTAHLLMGMYMYSTCS